MNKLSKKQIVAALGRGHREAILTSRDGFTAKTVIHKSKKQYTRKIKHKNMTKQGLVIITFMLLACFAGAQTTIIFGKTLNYGVYDKETEVVLGTTEVLINNQVYPRSKLDIRRTSKGGIYAISGVSPEGINWTITNVVRWYPAEASNNKDKLSK